MTRHQSVRFAFVVSSVFLCAGCAAHPERPAASPAHAGPAAPQKPPAHLFDGCKPLVTKDMGWAVGCGSTVARVSTYPGITPAKAVDASVESFGKSLKGNMRTSKGTVKVAGRSANATEVRLYRTPSDANPVFVGYFIGFDGSDGSVVAFCGGGSDKGAMRCPDLLAYLEAHPNKAPALAPVVASNGPWPPPAQVVMPAGCSRTKAGGPHEMDITCRDSALMIVRLADRPANVAGYHRAVAAVSKQMVLKAKRRTGKAPLITPLECNVAGKPGACSRIELSTGPGGATAVLGVGEMYGDTVVVECFEPTSGAALTPACSSFLQLTGAP